MAVLYGVICFNIRITNYMLLIVMHSDYCIEVATPYAPPL